MLDRNKTIIQQYKNKKARNAGPPLIAAFGSQRISEFEAYIYIFRIAIATQTNLVFKYKQTKMKRLYYQTTLAPNSS